MTIAGGNIKTLHMKRHTIIVAESTPNPASGTRSDHAVARNAPVVVKDVMKIARDDR